MIHRLDKLFPRRLLRAGLGILISAVSLYLAVREINLADILQVFSAAAWKMVLLALLCTCLNNLLKAVRWKVLLDPANAVLTYPKILMSFMAGQLFNSALPARAGELSRVYVIGEMGVSNAFVVGTILLEKILDMLSYALLILWMLIWFPHPDWLGQSGWVFTVFTFVILTGVLILILRKREIMAWLERLLLRLPDWAGKFSNGQFQMGFSSLAALESRKSLLNLAAITFGIWALAVLTNAFAFRALAIALPASAAIVLLIILQAGISLPAAPGKFGVFEYASMLALAIFGVSQEVSFSYGLLLHAIVLTPIVLAGMLSIWLLGLNQKNWKNLRQS